jgi:hypothetical protein
MRIRSVCIASVIAGGLGAAWTTSESLFVQVGCGLFWFFVTFSLLLWARASKSAEGRIRVPGAEGEDFWTDEQGVHHFQRDVFDLANHPHMGKHIER